MGISVLVELGDGKYRMPDIDDDAIVDYNTATRVGKNAIYNTRTKKVISFSGVYKQIIPSEIIAVKDKILGDKKYRITGHTISISNGIVRSTLKGETDYE